MLGLCHSAPNPDCGWKCLNLAGIKRFSLVLNLSGIWSQRQRVRDTKAFLHFGNLACGPVNPVSHGTWKVNSASTAFLGLDSAMGVGKLALNVFVSTLESLVQADLQLVVIWLLSLLSPGSF